MSQVHSLLTTLIASFKPDGCWFDHHWWLLDAFKLGLVQHLGANWGILDDEKGGGPNYKGVSFKNLSEQVESMKWIDNWCVCSKPDVPQKISFFASLIPIVRAFFNEGAQVWGELNIGKALSELIDTLEKEEWGLDLRSLQWSSMILRWKELGLLDTATAWF